MTYIFLIFKRFLFGFVWLFAGAAFVVLAVGMILFGFAEAIMVAMTVVSGFLCLFAPYRAGINDMFWHLLLWSGCGMGLIIVLAGGIMDFLSALGRKLFDKPQDHASYY